MLKTPSIREIYRQPLLTFPLKIQVACHADILALVLRLRKGIEIRVSDFDILHVFSRSVTQW